MKTQLITIVQRMVTLLWLSGILIIDSCQSCHKSNQAIQKPPGKEKKQELIPNEVIVFCGRPSVGKSTLCNSIFQQVVFKSGISIGKGMTTHEQEYIYEKKLYIDTPGLYDYTIELQKQAAQEIEKALKNNNKYKIVFVATLEGGRIDPIDLVTINTVCDAIKADFEYGIIFNQVADRIIQKNNQGELDKKLAILNKKPTSTVILKRESEIEDLENVYFRIDSENREKLLNFISKLSAHKILDKDVSKIDVSDFQKKIDEVAIKLKNVKN